MMLRGGAPRCRQYSVYVWEGWGALEGRVDGEEDMLRVQVASEEVSELLWAGVPGLKKSTTNPTREQEADLQHSSVT